MSSRTRTRAGVSTSNILRARPTGHFAAAHVLALALATLALLGPLTLTPVAIAIGAAAAHPRTTLPTIEREVMCVTCKIPLNIAESPQADRERTFIQHLIDAGQTEAQVKRTLVSQYGPAVLALPAEHGFDLAAYLVPLAVVLALLITLALLLPSWRRHARAHASDPAAAASGKALNPADAQRLDADLARFD